MKDYYGRIISERYPNLKIDQIEMNEIGQNNTVLIVNERFVFRFPKYLEGIEKLKKETKVLEHIGKRVSLPIPEPKYIHFESGVVGEVFTGYPLLSGTPLWPSEIKKVKKEVQIQKIAEQLVRFLSDLHSQPVDDLDVKKQRMEDLRHSTEKLYEAFKEKLFPYMKETSKKEVARNFEVFISDKKTLNFEPVLIHGDFGASNILWDAEREAVSGIIDFGETEVGDPAYDFAGLSASYGRSFLEKCLGLYTSDDTIMKRIEFYQSTFALQEALHGVENNDQKAFEEGMRGYR
ncbi:phosphotransferase family protein [Salimicrobium flavidum]|uniref:Aminoglycoside 2''-phosphotransferase n=1 Tax=Salimicrobium flavidum TaxID=570947 RepID=A0A1N7KPX8_9BACI|nr:phosphotransferase [Salimicrobium flavidum]SIS63546.1 aminoglycoside 2''-phosphotransferase [Salimicrobium flavidum]